MLRGLLTALSLIAIAATALADDQKPAAAPESRSQAVEEQGLKEVVVTAQRREQDVQRAAVAIQPISTEELNRNGVARPEDLSKVATGVSVGPGGNVPQIYVRGIGNYSTNVYSEGAVAFNLDGVYISRQWAERGTFFDLDRVEVLKGPQGTLYGRNATGGAINLITAQPRLGELSGYGELEGGNFSLIHFAGAVNIPVSDVLALRVAGQSISRSGYLSDGYDDDKEEAGRLHLLYKPSNDLSLLVTAEYEHVHGRGGGRGLMPNLPGSPWRGTADPEVNAIILAEPGIGPLLMKTGTDGFVASNVASLSANLTWNLGPATLTVIPAYRSGNHSNTFYEATYQLNEWEYDNQTSLEARLSNQSEHLSWVVGGYYFDDKQGNQDGRPIEYANANINGQYTSYFRADTSSYAAFGEATFSVTNAFRLTAGLRYTTEHKNQKGDNAGYAAAFLPSPPFPPFTCIPGVFVFDPATPVPYAPCRVDAPLSGSLTFNKATWKGGFEYDLADRSMLYANVSTGFKSGGFFYAPPPNSFKPEELTAYELGVKNRFLDNRLQLNIETFYWKYRDKQESHLGPTSVAGYLTFITENAGNAKSYGALADLKYQLTHADRITLAAQYDATRYDQFSYSYPSQIVGPPSVGCNVIGAPTAPQTVDCAGYQLVRAPLWVGNAGYDHTFSLPNSATITAGVSGQFSSGYYTAIDFLPIEYQKSYGILNADLTYTSGDGRWSVSGWGRNLTDKAVVTGSFRSPFVSPANPLADPQGFVFGDMRPPRTYGIRARVNF